VKEIGECAFLGCTELRKIEFGAKSGLLKISRFAFTFTAIETITIPAPVKELESGVFSSWPQLKTVTFEEGSQIMHYEDSG
jgi:hypothetical protein